MDIDSSQMIYTSSKRSNILVKYVSLPQKFIVKICVCNKLDHENRSRFQQMDTAKCATYLFSLQNKTIINQ